MGMTAGNSRRYRRLRLEALESCKRRGHDMGLFRVLWARPPKLTNILIGLPGDCWNIAAVSRCQKCGMDVRVHTIPQPNEVEIGGQAVALNCNGCKEG